ncbi:MAG: O-antigen ligase family protein, partial [Opitutales bacterium]|nr:O-antigen ligase family protein [Opitutales bacterium]
MGFLFCCIHLFFLIIRPQDWAVPWLAPLRPVLICQMLAVSLTGLDILSGKIRLPDLKNPWWVLINGLFLAVLLSHASHFYFAGLKFAFDDFLRIYLTFVVIWLNINSRQKLEVFTFFFLCMCIFVAVHCILMIHTGYGFGGQTANLRAIRSGGEIVGVVRQALYYGTFNDPNDAAQLMTLGLPLAAYFTFRHKNVISFLVGLLPIGTLVYAVYLTQSRGGYLSMAIAFAVAFRKFLTVKQFIIASAFGVLVLVMFLPSRFGARILDQSMTERVAFWGEANYAFKTSPIFGVGYKMITDYIEGDRATHNAYVQAYADLGVFGYIFWFGFVAFSFFAAWRIGDLKPEDEDDKSLVLWAKCIVPSLAGMY